MVWKYSYSTCFHLLSVSIAILVQPHHLVPSPAQVFCHAWSSSLRSKLTPRGLRACVCSWSGFPAMFSRCKVDLFACNDFLCNPKLLSRHNIGSCWSASYLNLANSSFWITKIIVSSRWWLCGDMLSPISWYFLWANGTSKFCKFRQAVLG